MRRRLTKSALGPAVLALVLLIAGCGAEDDAAVPIPFGPRTDTSLKDPDNPTKTFRVDFSRLEQLYPLTRSVAARITTERLQQLSQEELDEVYGRLTAGPLPDGPYRADVFFARGESLNDRVAEIIGGLKGRFAAGSINTLLSGLGLIWKGKLFYRDQGIARTFIEDFAPLRPLVDNVDTVMTTTIPRGGMLGVLLPRKSVWLLFPAKVYCGQSLLDARRESIIIDYNFGDEIEAYRANPDSLVGRGALRLRDEIRMVRPGLYLGRAYAGGVFLLNFILRTEEKSGAAQAAVEECWSGEQDRSAELH